MSMRRPEHDKRNTPVHRSVAYSGLVQRKCQCGGSSGFDRTCGSCQAKELAVPQRASMQSGHAFFKLGSGEERHNSMGFHPKVGSRAEPQPGYSFSHMRPTDQRGDEEQQASLRGKGVGQFAARSAGQLSMKVSPTSLHGANVTGTRAGEDNSPEQTGMSASTGGNRIDFTFDPTTSYPRPQCDEIVIVQLIQMTADGSAIMPGSYYTPWLCRDAVALSDANYIDHDCPCVTPYYTYCFNGSPGASNGVVRNATSTDAPQTGGGDRGFNSVANPSGWTKVQYKFETYGYCAAGTECGTWYDGVRWDYTKTATDHAAGSAGTATATASLLPPGAGSTVVRAFDKFNSEKGFTPCVASVIPRLESGE